MRDRTHAGAVNAVKTQRLRQRDDSAIKGRAGIDVAIRLFRTPLREWERFFPGKRAKTSCRRWVT